jgi:hypothetical protein
MTAIMVVAVMKQTIALRTVLADFMVLAAMNAKSQ